MAGLEIVDTLKLHANPTVVLISTRSEEGLENHLSRDARGIDRGDDASTFLHYNSFDSLLMHVDDIFGSYILDSRPSSDFNYEAAKNKIVNLELVADENPNIIFNTPGDELVGDGYADQGGVGRQGKLMRLAGWIDLDSRLTVNFPTII